MKIAKDIFRCLIVVNLALYLIVFCFMFIFQPSEESQPARLLWLGMIASWLLLLAFSLSLLFFDRQAAGRGFIVLLVGFLIAVLFPKL